jgi:hypothetical protein
MKIKRLPPERQEPQAIETFFRPPQIKSAISFETALLRA